MEILRYHSKNKPLDNEGLLSSVAEVTQVVPISQSMSIRQYEVMQAHVLTLLDLDIAVNVSLSHPTITQLHHVSAQGWSAASLANLMNESAILTVRRNVEKITLPMVLELVEGINWGTPAGKIPPSEAKNRSVAPQAEMGIK